LSVADLCQKDADKHQNIMVNATIEGTNHETSSIIGSFIWVNAIVHLSSTELVIINGLLD
jgi:hypothetical protein